MYAPSSAMIAVVAVLVCSASPTPAAAVIATHANAADAPIPAEMFAEQAERRVKLGLVLAELVKANELQAKPEQIRAEVDEFAKSYEDPKEVVRWYYSNQQRLAEMEAYVVESNVVDFVLGKAKVTDKEVSFEELASATAQA